VTRRRSKQVRIRWERVGRVALLVVLAIVVGLYVQQGLRVFSVHRQAEQQLQSVHQLQHANASLTKQERALNNPATIKSDARALGMVLPTERSYVVTGLPTH
jgi:hypothetical protein